MKAALKLHGGTASGHVNGEPWVADRSLIDGVLEKLESGVIPIDPPEARGFVLAQAREQFAFLSGCSGHITIDIDMSWPEPSDPPVTPEPTPGGGIAVERPARVDDLVHA